MGREWKEKNEELVSNRFGRKTDKIFLFCYQVVPNFSSKFIGSIWNIPVYDNVNWILDCM